MKQMVLRLLDWPLKLEVQPLIACGKACNYVKTFSYYKGRLGTPFYCSNNRIYQKRNSIRPAGKLMHVTEMGLVFSWSSSMVVNVWKFWCVTDDMTKSGAAISLASCRSSCVFFSNGDDFWNKPAEEIWQTVGESLLSNDWMVGKVALSPKLGENLFRAGGMGGSSADTDEEIWCEGWAAGCGVSKEGGVGGESPVKAHTSLTSSFTIDPTSCTLSSICLVLSFSYCIASTSSLRGWHIADHTPPQVVDLCWY